MECKKLNLYFVLGGAVSAGAYTAGVLDFFVHYLQKYMNQSDSDRDYDIKIKAVAGASAGGMCGAILTGDLAKAKQNELFKSSQYNAWVKQIDISRLVGVNDLKNNQVASLLNGGALFDIADNAFTGIPYGVARDLPNYVDSEFKLILSVTNTNGLSYAVKFINSDLKNPYFITNHRDYFNFTFQKEGQANDYVSLNNLEDWSFLKKAAVATGAFPIGLPPVPMERPVSVYQNRIKDSGFIPFNLGGETHNYFAIDGGAGDNEPLGQIQKLLEKDIKYHKENSIPFEHAVIFIDPFPSERKQNKNNSIFAHFGRLYTVLRNQSAYKPHELVPFILEKNNAKANQFNGFFIAPKREGTTNEELQVAGGAFGAFGGFMHESYRHFDYNLGKRNCQKFMADYLKLPNEDKVIVNTDLGAPVGALSWPSITKKEFKVIAKPLNKRLRKIILMLSWRILLPIVKFVKPAKLIYKSLYKHGLIQ